MSTLAKKKASYMSQVTAELFTAARKGKEREIQRAIDAGAHRNATDWDGKTPLMVAAEAGNLPAVMHLLRLGADPHLKCEGVTALELARTEAVRNQIRAHISKARLSPPLP